MNAAAQAGVDSRGRRFGLILGTFVAVVPSVIAAVVVSVACALFPYDLAWAVMVFGFLWAFTLPLALVSGSLFGALAVFRGHARLRIALAPAVLMPVPVNVAMGNRWTYLGPANSVIVVALFALPLLLAWALSRRWHR